MTEPQKLTIPLNIISPLQPDGKVRCVWSGDTISRYDIDHIIPFTIWKNNDLWNLLPARPDLNKRKRDKIPSPALIDRQSGLITHYWEVIHRHSGLRFRKEMLWRCWVMIRQVIGRRRRCEL